MKKHLILSIIFSLSTLISTLGQGTKKSLNYQAVILDPKAIDIPGASLSGQPLSKGKVCLKFSFVNAQGNVDYEETQQTTTDEYGLVSLAVGTGTYNGGTYKNFESIVWDANVKSMRVAVSYDGCTSFKQVSTQALNYTPYALYAEAVDYKNVKDAPTKLSQFSNDAGYLIPKDLDPLKADIKTNTADIKTNTADIKTNTADIKINAGQIASANQSIADNKKSSDESFLVVNQSISDLGTKVTSNTNSIVTIEGKINEQQNILNDTRNQLNTTTNTINNQINGLQYQVTTTANTVNSLSNEYQTVANKSTSTNLGGASPSDQLYPSQKAAKSYVDNAIYNAVGTGVADATTLAPGKVRLAGDLAGTANAPTVPALANKENTSNKSTNVTTDGNSDIKYPSAKAVKSYVDQATQGIALQAAVDAKADKNSPVFTGTPNLPTGTIAVTQNGADNSTKIATTAFVQQATAAGIIDASSTTKGKLKLSGDLGGTAESPTVPGLALKANSSEVNSALALKEDASNKSTATSLGTSDAFYPSQKAVKTYVDAQIASATIADADASTKGKIQLAGDLGGTATSPTVPGLALKANSADVNTALGLKAPINNPTFTGTVGGITRSMVGLGNVDNTSDANKPVSSATQTALDLKATLASPTFTGSPSLPSGTTAVTQLIGDNSTKLATTEFVTTKLASGAPDATTTATGKVQLAGDLGGTASSPTVPGLALKANISDVNSALALKANSADVTTSLALKEDASNKSTASALGTSDAFYPSQKAVKTYVDNAIYNAVGTGVADATTLAPGKVQLAGDLAGTAIAPTVPGLALKANTSDVNSALALKANTSTVNSALGLKADSSAVYTAIGQRAKTTDVNSALALKANTSDVTTSLALKANSSDVTTSLTLKEDASNKSSATDLGTSDAFYPSQNAVKTYVDNAIYNAVGTGVADATTLAPGKVQLAGDLAGTATAPTVPGLALKANTSDVNSALALKANSADVNAALALKANTATVNSALSLKADSSAVFSAIGLRAKTSDVNSDLALKAPLASPNFTGTPILPSGTIAFTQTAGNNSTSVATTAFVTDAVSSANNTNANLTGPITSVGNATSITSQTGSGTKFVMDTSPTLVTPTIGVAIATSVNKVTITNPGTSATLTIADGKTLTANNSLTLAGTDGKVLTFPTTDATIARTDASQTFSGKQTFDSTGIALRGLTSGTATLVAPAIAGTTTITLPRSSGTLATLTGTETLTNKTLTSPTLTSPALGTPTSGVLTNATGLPMTTGVIGTLPVSNGGTGQTSLIKAFNSLSPLSRQGDIIYYDGTNAVKLSSGSSPGSFLSLVNSSNYPFNPIPTWASPTDVFNTIKDVVTALPNVKLVSGALSNISNLTTLTSLPNLNLSNITSSLSPSTLSLITQVGNLVSGSIPYSLLTGNVPIWNQSTTGGANYLNFSRLIYGNAFDGTSNVNGIIASSYGGTGNGFTKFSGPNGTEKIFTLPNANATILTSNATITVAQGGTGLTAAGLDGQILISDEGTFKWLTPQFAPLNSPTFSGTPTLPGGTLATTQASGDSTNAIATTAFVDAIIDKKFIIGLNNELGGYIFYVTPNGKHGLVAETEDDFTGQMSWYEAQNSISSKENHSTYGKNFTDWRLPTKNELNLMYAAKDSIGGFTSNLYWSSTESSSSNAWFISAGVTGNQLKTDNGMVRAVRAF